MYFAGMGRNTSTGYSVVWLRVGSTVLSSFGDDSARSIGGSAWITAQTEVSFWPKLVIEVETDSPFTCKILFIELVQHYQSGHWAGIQRSSLAIYFHGL